MAEPGIRGRFVWYDLMTTDIKAGQRFYTGVFGWGLESFEGAGMPYVMWTRKKTPIGGSMPLPPATLASGARPHWLPYIATPDVDDTVVRARKLGATTLAGPMDIPTVGRFASLQDPQGAAFAAFTPLGGTQRPDGDPLVGEVSWHELVTSDHKAALRFYSALFGWEKGQAADMGAPVGVYQMYGRAGRTLGGMFDKPKEMPFPPHWLLYVRVADIGKVLGQVRKLGGSVLNGPMHVPGGDVIAQCLDPQGAAFAVHEKAAAAPAKKPAARKQAPKKRVTPKKLVTKKKRVTKKAARQR